MYKPCQFVFDIWLWNLLHRWYPFSQHLNSLKKCCEKGDFRCFKHSNLKMFLFYNRVLPVILQPNVSRVFEIMYLKLVTIICHQHWYSHIGRFLYFSEDVDITVAEKEASSFSFKFVIQEQSWCRITISLHLTWISS